MKDTTVQKDRGARLVFDMTNQPLHYWHEVDLLREDTKRVVTARLGLRRQGFGYHRGYRDGHGVAWDIYGRTEPVR